MVERRVELEVEFSWELKSARNFEVWRWGFVAIIPQIDFPFLALLCSSLLIPAFLCFPLLLSTPFSSSLLFSAHLC